METGADSQGFLHQAPFASSSSLRHFHDRPTDLGEPVLWGAFHNSLLLDARMHIIKSCFLLHNCGDKLQQLRQQASSVKICGVSAAPSVPPGCSRACVRACLLFSNVDCVKNPSKCEAEIASALHRQPLKVSLSVFIISNFCETFVMFVDFFSVEDEERSVL